MNRIKNFRRRIGDGDEEEEEKNSIEINKVHSTKNTTTANTTASISRKSSAKLPPPPTTTPKSKKPMQQITKLLSFADDEDTEAPSLRPSSSSSTSRLPKSSSASHRITTVKDRISPSASSLPSNVQPQAGIYTKEALRELQKNTKTLASSRPISSSEGKPRSEPVVVLKGMVKPVDYTDVVYEDSEENSVGEEDVGRGMVRIGKENSCSGPEIPDQATISAIRAKRERLRQSRGVNQDYVPLEREVDEEHEFRGRTGGLGETMNDAKKGVFEDINGRVGDVKLDDELVVGDEEEEEKIWEEEQFRKGLGKRIDDGCKRIVGGSVSATQSSQNQRVITSVSGVSFPSNIGNSVGSSHEIGGISVAQQADIAKRALKDNLQRLKDSHDITVSALIRTDENLSSSLSNITSLEDSLSAAGEKFIYMQKLRHFVSVICDFLQDKAPFIEELEEQMQKLHEERASAVSDRRAGDEEDEMAEVETAVGVAMSVLGKGGPGSPKLVAAAAQAASASARERANMPVILDEFGRDTNQQRRMDRVRRAEARRRRRSRSDSKRLSALGSDGSYQKVEGESSTDESEGEATAYISNREMLLVTAGEIFGDASEEFARPDQVMAMFQGWKRRYPSSYRDAYVSLSVPAIFSPFVRLELLGWDPLHQDDSHFHAMKWHSLLFNFGMPVTEGGFEQDDPDMDLVPKLVEKIALPIMHHEIAHCWDTLSTAQTKNAVSAVSLLLNYVPTSCDALLELISAIRSRLSQTVSDITVPVWGMVAVQVVPNAARVVAYRFGESVRLMRNICLWKDVLALPVLEKLALDDLLSRKLLPHLRGLMSTPPDALTRTERVVGSMRGVWAGTGVPGEHSRKLEGLVEYVTALARTVERKHGADGADGGLGRRLKKIMVELNQYDRARDISRTFHLKEAV